MKRSTYRDSVLVEAFQVHALQKDTMYSALDYPPGYMPGMRKFYQYISDRMVYPKSARRAGIEGWVYVRFIINENGVLSDAEIVKGLAPACDSEVLRVVQKLNSWKAGIHNGRPVKACLVLPVIFKIN